jgi:hypothetical protein
MNAETSTIEIIELGVTPAYATTHGWVVPAITGFLSAYYMEDPRFRVARRWAEDGGRHFWLCELQGGMSMTRLVRRLQADIPPCRLVEEAGGPGVARRILLDVPH